MHFKHHHSFFVFGQFYFSWNICWTTGTWSLWLSHDFPHMCRQMDGIYTSVSIRRCCELTGWGCGVETTHLMNEADDWRGGLVMRRRGEESDGWWLSEKWLRSSKSSFGYLCLSVDSPHFLPLLLSCSTPLFHLPQFSFNTLYLKLSNTHALFMAFDYPHHYPHPIFTTLLK